MSAETPNDVTVISEPQDALQQIAAAASVATRTPGPAEIEVSQ
jgi:hypothetical protein